MIVEFAGPVRVAFGGASDPGPWARSIAALYPSGRVLEGNSPPEIDLVVETDRLVIHEPSTGVRHRCASRGRLMARLEFLVNARILAGVVDDRAPIHAAGLVSGDAALLVLGGSGAGKSTLALAWSRAGHPILGDDVVLLDSEGWVHPHPRPIKVERVQLADFGIDPEETLEHDPEMSEVWVDPAAAGGWSGPTRLGVIVIARYRPDAPPAGAVEAMDPPGTLPSLMASLIEVEGRETSEILDWMIPLSLTRDCITITFSSARAAVDPLRTRLLALWASASPTDR
ncbi:MAG: hypothetical protein RQ745_13920 [Longimicrobiales bacterium]|nr:hypothetical protein [Longimicrobiales bacterium]